MKRILTSLFFLIICLFSQLGVAQQATLRIGTGHFYPPFIYNYSSGFDIALANALCKQMDVSCIFYSMSLTEMLTSLQTGKVDAIIGAISITSERQKYFTFSNPYLISTVSFLGMSGQEYPPTLNGVKVGVIAYSSFDTYLEAAAKLNAKIETYTNYGDLLDALQKGKINIIMLDTAAADYWVSQSEGELRLIGDPFPLDSDKGFGIAVRGGNVALASQINQALEALLTNGTYARLIQTHFVPASNGGAVVIAPPWISAQFPNAAGSTKAG